MSISKLYDFLEQKDFLDPETSIITTVYIYTYDAKDEYLVRDEITELSKRLERPLAMVETLILNLFELTIEYLQFDTLNQESSLDQIMKQEKVKPKLAINRFERKINDDKFFQYINSQIVSHFSKESNLKKSYVFLHGIGTMFPYLRARNFISKIEKYMGNYKLIIFYPGTFEAGHYHLFGILPGSHIYRANHLNPLIEKIIV